jgi:GntR family transcriptional regulator
MSQPKVSRTRGIPLHIQIRRAILDQITNDGFHPGDQLPTEHEYARQFEVSLAPVRQALLDLVAAGHLVRVKGRGTFVREQQLEEEITLLSGFTENLRKRNISFEMRVLTQGLAVADEELAEALALTVGASLVRLRRIALVRGEPAALLDAYLPADRFGALLEAVGFETGESLYRRLADDFGIRVRHAHNSLRVIRCNEEQAEYLDVAVGAPALLVRSVTLDQDGRAVEVSHVLYRADRFTFNIDALRQ